MNTLTNNQTDSFIKPEPVADSNQPAVVIPVIAEQLLVDKQTIDTGEVRISKTVREDEQVIDLPLTHETVDVQRVEIGEPVSAVPAVRQEGNTTIYPVLKEVIVVEKRLILVEEIRVTTQQTVIHEPQTVTVRREEVNVERTTPANIAERPTPQDESSL